MFSPAASSGAESAGEPGPSAATVDSDAARFTELNHGPQNRHVHEAQSDGRGSSTVHPLRREELIPDSMRKTTLANLETKTLKAFRNIFTHHKNAHALLIIHTNWGKPEIIHNVDTTRYVATFGC
jgi:hypothetical protein